jgi:hypothetical protein
MDHSNQFFGLEPKLTMKVKENSMTRSVTFLCAVFLTLICFHPLSHATTECAYDFATGSGSTYLGYCVTENGNILDIQAPSGQNLLGSFGEGYGLCDQNAPANYDDYAVSDTGNWQSARVVSHNASSIKIVRTTTDGNWTLTQTITLIKATSTSTNPSIKVVLALKNNQTIADTAYLIRFADVEPSPSGNLAIGGPNSAIGRTYQPDPNYGLELSNLDVPPLHFTGGFAQYTSSGPNACAFAQHEGDDNLWYGEVGASIVMAYVAIMDAGETVTVTFNYHSL